MRIRIIGMALLVTLIITGLTACGKDEDKKEQKAVSPYVGTWICDTNEPNYLYLYGQYPIDGLPKIELREDHTVWYIEEESLEYEINPYYPDRLYAKEGNPSNAMQFDQKGDTAVADYPYLGMVFNRVSKGDGIQGTWVWDTMASKETLVAAPSIMKNLTDYEVTLVIDESSIRFASGTKHFFWDEEGTIASTAYESFSGTMFLNGDYLRIDFLDGSQLFLQRVK